MDALFIGTKERSTPVTQKADVASEVFAVLRNNALKLNGILQRDSRTTLPGREHVLVRTQFLGSLRC